MAQLEKIAVQEEIKSSGDMFYEILWRKAQLLPKICPKMFNDIQLLEGNWDSVGSVKQWTYYDAAGNCVKGKETVKEIDKQNRYIVFEILDGDLMNYYKSFSSSLNVTQKEDGTNLAKWTLEYEKLNEGIPAPSNYLDYVATMTKNIDAYLLRA